MPLSLFSYTIIVGGIAKRYIKYKNSSVNTVYYNRKKLQVVITEHNLLHMYSSLPNVGIIFKLFI